MVPKCMVVGLVPFTFQNVTFLRACGVCSLENEMSVKICVACSSVRDSSEWACSRCTYHNDRAQSACFMCGLTSPVGVEVDIKRKIAAKKYKKLSKGYIVRSYKRKKSRGLTGLEETSHSASLRENGNIHLFEQPPKKQNTRFPNWIIPLRAMEKPRQQRHQNFPTWSSDQLK